MSNCGAASSTRQYRHGLTIPKDLHHSGVENRQRKEAWTILRLYVLPRMTDHDWHYIIIKIVKSSYGHQLIIAQTNSWVAAIGSGIQIPPRFRLLYVAPHRSPTGHDHVYSSGAALADRPLVAFFAVGAVAEAAAFLFRFDPVAVIDSSPSPVIDAASCPFVFPG
jgi:hypothetical protein